MTVSEKCVKGEVEANLLGQSSELDHCLSENSFIFSTVTLVLSQNLSRFLYSLVKTIVSFIVIKNVNIVSFQCVGWLNTAILKTSVFR